MKRLLIKIVNNWLNKIYNSFIKFIEWTIINLLLNIEKTIGSGHTLRLYISETSFTIQYWHAIINWWILSWHLQSFNVRIHSKIYLNEVFYDSNVVTSIILYSGTAVDLLIILMLFLPKEKAEKTSLTSI